MISQYNSQVHTFFIQLPQGEQYLEIFYSPEVMTKYNPSLDHQHTKPKTLNPHTMSYPK